MQCHLPMAKLVSVPKIRRRIAQPTMARPAVTSVWVLLLMAFPSWQGYCLANETPVKPECNVSNETTTCVCKQDPPGPVAVSEDPVPVATLSESVNVIRVECHSPLTFVPSDQASICLGEASLDTLKVCQKDNPKKVMSPINELLTPTPPVDDVKWISSDNHHYSLTVPRTNFPFTDKAFFVGCQNNNQKHCVVPLMVKARKSVLEDKVLKCAYGTDSNTPVPELTLDPTSNSLTVDCGEDGTMPLTGELPTVYYCKDSATDACDPVKDVTEILPGFAKEWWTPVNGLKTAAKLTVPEGGFPVEPKTVVLGCNPKRAKAKVDAEPESHAEGGLPTCRVKVTFDAPSSSSSGMRLSLNTLAFLSALFSLASLV
ncbi:SAG-related sequence [Besnoitia besnoiti]|uniref:SAG-related sequence n=1 Tax=Besnoitia besnoiti TaxID=94643 RepID=A0A2A9MG61_BESBE|nr:SAG-related sequence [Besnoitia besnoiti]PFH35261.1 SAG-related sequence [Besnoitia besnoiti]